MNDDQTAQYPEWFPSALRKSLVDIANLPPMRVGEPPFADLADLWSRGELWWFDEQGIVKLCSECGKRIGVPDLGGRCVSCDEGDRGKDLDLHLRTALGYERGAEPVQIAEFKLPDASAWDNRTFRGWQNFHCHLLVVTNLGDLLAARPMRWTVAPSALPPNAQKSRLILKPASAEAHAEPPPWREYSRDAEDAEDAEALVARLERLEQQWAEDAEKTEKTRQRLNEQLAIVRLHLWRPGKPGYLQGLWDGQRQRIRWDLCDVGEVANPDWPMWLAAISTAMKRGARLGTNKTFASYSDFLQACRTSVTAMRQQAQTHTLRGFKSTRWENLCAGKISQDELARLLNTSKPVLARALREYRDADGLTWPNLKRQLAALAAATERADGDWIF